MITAAGTECTLRLALPVPPSVNHAWRRGRYGQTYRVKACEEYTAQVRLAVVAAGWPCGFRLAPPIAVTIRLTLPPTWKRRADLDNLRKVLYDALALSLGFDDDEIGEEHGYKRRARCQKPLLEVEISGQVRPARV